MRTMPAELRSSVVVVSTARAQRMQRRTCTEALGGTDVSIVKPAVEEEEDDDESESEAVEEAEPKAEFCRVGMTRESRGWASSDMCAFSRLWETQARKPVKSVNRAEQRWLRSTKLGKDGTTGVAGACSLYRLSCNLASCSGSSDLVDWQGGKRHEPSE